MNYPLSKRIRAIHPFGPRVGDYRPGAANVAETFKRVRNRLQAEAWADPFAPEWFKVLPSVYREQ